MRVAPLPPLLLPPPFPSLHSVCALPDAVLAQDYLVWIRSRSAPALATTFSLCMYRFLFDADAKRRILGIDVTSRQTMVRCMCGCRS